MREFRIIVEVHVSNSTFDLVVSPENGRSTTSEMKGSLPLKKSNARVSSRLLSTFYKSNTSFKLLQKNEWKIKAILVQISKCRQ